jgi:predicted outer membrane repeat protein
LNKNKEKFNMAVIMVTNTNDSGLGSLRNAVQTANPDDIIRFGVSGTITLINPIDINKTLEIRGPNGHPVLAISGGSNTRIFNISGANTRVVIFGLTLENGNDILGTGGGAILNIGSVLHVNNCTFLNNKSSTTGGAIQNQDSGRIFIFRCSFTGNTATSGGAIRNHFPFSTNVEIDESTLSNNSATSGIGGGAILNDGTLRTIKTTLQQNSAPNGVGGAIFNDGKVTIIQTLIQRNSATSGGGIANIPPGTLSNLRSIIRLNTPNDIIGVAPTVDESSSDHSHHPHHHHHPHHPHHHHDESDDERSS